MRKKLQYKSLILIYLVILSTVLLFASIANKAITVITVNAPIARNKTVIIDAGHGGVDGGAISCTGVSESKINLEIALKLNDLMHLLGIQTIMIRDTDISVYTKGETISQKKSSDLTERVRIVNSTPNAILVSIHQNHFTDGRYSGAQVFYAPTEGSQPLAESLQNTLVNALNPTSNRRIKKADGVYLMQHIQCPGVLIECGFLSNQNEEYKLRTKNYQQQIAMVIACCISNNLFSS